MGMVEKIQKLEHPGTLRNFRWPTDMLSFGRYNLIYGWNGSGKTTISRLFRFLEMGKPATFDVALSINGRNVNGSDFEQVSIPVRVFNRDFVLENVFPTGGGDMAPILVLGKDSVQKQQEIERLKKKRAAAEATLQKVQSNKNAATKALDQHCIDRAKAIKNTLRSSAPSRYNNYNKSNYRQRAEDMVSRDGVTSHRLSDIDRDTLFTQHHAKPKEKIGETSYQLPVLSTYAKEVSHLLEKTVFSTAIQSLKDDQALSSWVHEGLGLHQARDSHRCLFCNQVLPEDRLRALEAHFSAEYEQFLNSIDRQLATLRKVSEEAETLTLPHHTVFYEDLVEEYKSAKAKLDGVLKTVKDFLDSLMEEAEQKKGRVFESCTLDIPVPEIPSGIAEDVNQVVKRHNRACNEFETRIKQARERLENDSVEETLDDFKGLVDAEDKLLSAVAQASSEVERLAKQIKELELDIVEHRRPADELNGDLHRYLGHGELQLAVKDTGYEIMRNGKSAQALSEGESTAIALLYFLKSLQDRGFDSSRGVVVLDDPVSSLDANALFLAFGYIQQRTQEVAQLFILTHNFSFFRNVRNWFHHLKGQRKPDINARPARFYMLNWRFSGPQRFSELRPLDPLLEWHESEYHYLFSRIYLEAQATSATALEENYVLPNMARRLLEGFLAFRRPQASGELWNKLRDMDFDGAAKTRIMRFVHTYSHSDFIGEPEHDLSSLAEARSVLQDILDFMKSQDPGHFEAMKSLVQTAAISDDE